METQHEHTRERQMPVDPETGRKRLHEGKPVLFAAGTLAGECEEMSRRLLRMSGRAWA